jgi:hypothetical protein
MMIFGINRAAAPHRGSEPDEAGAIGRPPSPLPATAEAESSLLRARWSCWLVIFLVPVIWLAPALRPGMVLSSADMLLGSYLLNHAMPRPYKPSNPLIGDTVMQMVPWHHVVSQALRRGHVPFWNPHALAGSPLLGNGQSGAFDLLSFPYLLTSHTVDATVWVALLRMWVAGLGAFLLARRLGATPWAAVASAVIYQAGGFTLVWLMYANVASSAWFPWVLLAAEGVAATRGLRPIALFAGALTLVVFGGQLEVAFFAAVAAAAYVVARRAQLGGASAGVVLRAAGTVGISGVLTALLSAPQTLPFIDALSQGTLAAGRSATWSVMPARLDWFLLSVFPYLFGKPLAGSVNLAGSYTNFCEHSGAYASVIGLALAIVGLASVKRRSPWTVVALLGAVAWVSSASLPPVSWLAHVVPVLNVTAPQRAVFVALLAISLLAARGIDAIREARSDTLRRVLGWGVAALAAIGLADGLWLLRGAPGYLDLLRLAGRSATIRSWFGSVEKLLVDSFSTIAPALAREYVLPWTVVVGAAAIVLLCARRLKAAFAPACVAAVVADLAAFGWGFNPAIPSGQAYPRTQRLEELRATAGDGRILVLNWGLYANVASYYGLDDINGYDAIGRRRLTELLRLGCAFPAGPIHWEIAYFDCYNSPVIDVLGVTAVASAQKLAAPALEFVSHPPAGGYLYRNRSALGRAFVPDPVIPARNLEDALRIARTSPPDPHRGAIVEAPGSRLAPGSGTVAYRRVSDSEIALQTSMERGGVVAVSESWDPGWDAFVDGRRTRVYPCDVALMAVSVPRGHHAVRLRFRPRGWEAAVAAWLLGVAVLLGSLAKRAQRRSRGRPPAAQEPDDTALPDTYLAPGRPTVDRPLAPRARVRPRSPRP